MWMEESLQHPDWLLVYDLTHLIKLIFTLPFVLHLNPLWVIDVHMQFPFPLLLDFNIRAFFR